MIYEDLLGIVINRYVFTENLPTNLASIFRLLTDNNQDMINYSKAMSEVRVTVEWLFGNIKNYSKFIDFKKEMKLCLSPVGIIYAVCGLLQNAHTSLYENQVSTIFGMDPISLQEYFS